VARFLVDEDLPRSVTRELRSAGFDIVDVRDVGRRGRPDGEVLEYAVREARAVITADVEFGNILRFPLGEHAGILVARFPNEVSTRELVAALLGAVTLLGDEDVAGNVVTIIPGHIRIRRAPVS
jgi:predicted nuclease of predicted toxin-antitoxin system